MHLEALVKLINDKVQLVEFIIQRKDAKPILLQVLQNYVNDLPMTLIDIPAIFDKIDSVYRGHLENEIQSQVFFIYQLFINAQIFSINYNYNYK